MQPSIYGELHWRTWSAQFGAGAGHDYFPEWESPSIIRARAVSPQELRGGVVPVSNWTMGVLRADQGAIDDYARPRFYKVDWLPRFAVISISVHVSEAAHSNQSVRVGEDGQIS